MFKVRRYDRIHVVRNRLLYDLKHFSDRDRPVINLILLFITEPVQYVKKQT